MRYSGVDFALTDEQQGLRAELRQYFHDLLTPEMQAQLWADEMGGPIWKQAVKQIAADGWLGIGWPKEYGGQDRSPIEQLIFFDEAQRAEAPVPMLSINTVGPTIMRFGTEDQKDRFLPGILAGDLNFAIGYTEPGSGTDLASLKTKAVRDGDEYVVNGQKIYTSLAMAADYVWLAARTDPDAPRHKGISIFLMPTDTPGFTVAAAEHHGWSRHHGHLLRGRPHPGGQPGGRGERGLGPHHQPAQLRAGGHLQRGPDLALPGGGHRLGEGHPDRRR